MNLLKSLATVSSMTMFSRLLGFVRDAIIAKIFGAEMATDAFFTAFKVPNLLRRIFAEGAFSQAFIPILSEYKQKKDKNEIRVLISYISGLLILVLLGITLVGSLLVAPWIIMIIAPGFTNIENKFILTVNLLRITFPYILLISLASLISAILNTWNLFSVPSVAPTFLNISIISFALFTSKHFSPPVLALAWAVILGGVLQFAYQIPYLKKIGMLIFPRINLNHVGVTYVIKQIGPAIVGISINQISLLLNTAFSSFLVSGTISWIYYADRLMECPSGVLGAALGTILLPSLSKSLSRGDIDGYQRLIDWGLRLCLLLALPSAAGLGILAKPLIISLFQYGKFTSFDVEMTQYAVLAYSFGLVGLIMMKVLAPSFYARKDTKTPLKSAIFTLIATQTMNIIFIGPLKHAGLALSTSLGACMNASLLYWQLRRKKIFIPQSGWRIFFIQLMIAVFMMAVVLVSLIYIMPEWSSSTMPYRLLRLIIVVVIGGMAYFGTLLFLGFKMKELRCWIRRD